MILNQMHTLGLLTFGDFLEDLFIFLIICLIIIGIIAIFNLDWIIDKIDARKRRKREELERQREELERLERQKKNRKFMQETFGGKNVYIDTCAAPEILGNHNTLKGIVNKLCIPKEQFDECAKNKKIMGDRSGKAARNMMRIIQDFLANNKCECNNLGNCVDYSNSYADPAFIKEFSKMSTAELEKTVLITNDVELANRIELKLKSSGKKITIVPADKISSD